MDFSVLYGAMVLCRCAHHHRVRNRVAKGLPARIRLGPVTQLANYHSRGRNVRKRRVRHGRVLRSCPHVQPRALHNQAYVLSSATENTANASFTRHVRGLGPVENTSQITIDGTMMLRKGRKVIRCE